MYNRAFRTAHRLEGTTDNAFPRLRQYLNRHSVRNEIFFDQSTDKGIFRFRRSRKAYLNFLEAQFHQHEKKLYFRMQVHRLYKRLISVAQIYAAPIGRFIGSVFRYPIQTGFLRQKILLRVFLKIFHETSSRSLVVHFYHTIIFRKNQVFRNSTAFYDSLIYQKTGEHLSVSPASPLLFSCGSFRNTGTPRPPKQSPINNRLMSKQWPLLSSFPSLLPQFSLLYHKKLHLSTIVMKNYDILR